VINIPVWCVIYWSDSSQFDLYFWGLISLLIVSNIGSFIGLWFSVNLKRFSK
jgi:hypothetical protein